MKKMNFLLKIYLKGHHLADLSRQEISWRDKTNIKNLSELFHMHLKEPTLENVFLHLEQEKIPQNSQEEDLMVKNICCICNMRNLTHHIVIHYDEYVGEHIKSDH